MQLSFNVRLATILLLGMVVWSGCTSPWFIKADSNSPDAKRARIRKQLEKAERALAIYEIASPRQLTFGALENIGLVTHLPATGGIVKPSAQREKLLDMMRRNDVPDPNALLDSKETAMVAALTAVPPAARKGDRINVSIKLSNQAEATDLRQGWLRETPLVEMGNLGGKVRESFERARAEGPLVTLAQYTGKDDANAKLEAVIVGGAKLMRSRELGLALSKEFADAIVMAAIMPSINDRFTYFDGSKQSGVATPVSDDYVELQIPPRYAADPYHYVNVVLQVRFNETSAQRMERMNSVLARDIQNPEKTAEACYALEAIGAEAKDILASQIDNPDPEVRFYSAHSLAYLGDTRAIPALTELTIGVPAFRAKCLNALTSMDHYQAEEALKGLLSDGEPEVCYGAVRSLRQRNSRNPLVVGEQITKVGSLLDIPTPGQAFVAVSMVDTPEIVFFGQTPKLRISGFHNVNSSILIQPSISGQSEITITRFVPGGDDMSVVCADDLRSVLQSIAHVGGSYGDWVSFVRECQEQGLIDIPVVMNPVPAAKEFDRHSTASMSGEASELVGALEPSNRSAMPDSSINDDSDSRVDQRESWYKPWSWWN